MLLQIGRREPHEGKAIVQPENLMFTRTAVTSIIMPSKFKRTKFANITITSRDASSTEIVSTDRGHIHANGP